MKCSSGKLRHASDQDARAYARRWGPKAHLRVYSCKLCGGYHLTSSRRKRRPAYAKWYGVELPPLDEGGA